MAKTHGLWISLGDEAQTEKFESAIQDRDRITCIVSWSKIRPKDAELVIVSVTGVSADYLAVSRKGRQAATDGMSLALSRFVDLGRIRVNRLKGLLPSKFSKRFTAPKQGAARITPRLWQELLEVVVGTRASLAQEIKRLRRLIAEYKTSQIRHDGGLEVFERDAVACALQAWGGLSYRKRILRSIAPADKKSQTDEVAPFLSQLKQVSLREDPQIGHDHFTFPGMSVAKKYLVGAVELENNGERLTILNCNRQPLERTLGVDLIYYNHRFDSFVLVQYKRMTGESSDKVAYRPTSDKSYEAELGRMRAVGKLLKKAKRSGEGETDTFRLMSYPFFLKLCQAKMKSAFDEGMVSGMYVPLGLWTRFMKSNAARGKLGGLAVGWNNAPRHFSNGDFTKLLRHGWIGSKAGQSKLLTKIIRSVLEGDHMLVVAATSSARAGEDYLRDSFGRFAPDEDPTASR